MLDIRLYLAQRVTAMIMAPLVLIHIGVMIYAVQGGLTAAEILGRTQGSWFCGLVYGLFVICVAILAGIGLRVVMHEWLRFTGKRLNGLTILLTLLFLGLGVRAVYAVVLA